jgi:hypothetical protein
MQQRPFCGIAKARNQKRDSVWVAFEAVWQGGAWPIGLGHPAMISSSPCHRPLANEALMHLVDN